MDEATGRCIGAIKKYRGIICELEDKIKELELKNEQNEKEIHLLKVENYSPLIKRYKKGRVYLIDLKKNRCEIEDEKDGILYNCFIHSILFDTILLKEVYFQVDKTHTPSGFQKQNVCIKEIIHKTSEPNEILEPTETNEILEPTETNEILEPTETNEILEPSEPNEILEPSEPNEILEPSEPNEIHYENENLFDKKVGFNDLIHSFHQGVSELNVKWDKIYERVKQIGIENIKDTSFLFRWVSTQKKNKREHKLSGLKIEKLTSLEGWVWN
jgi:hypothetical protein